MAHPSKSAAHKLNSVAGRVKTLAQAQFTMSRFKIYIEDENDIHKFYGTTTKVSCIAQTVVYQEQRD